MATIINPAVPMLRKPYTPVKAKVAKAMTVAVGLVGDGYAVLAADRQFTYSGLAKYSQQKFSIHRTKTIELIFMFAGVIGLAQEIEQKIFSQIDSLAPNEQNIKSIYALTDATLTEMGRLNRVFEGNLQFLLAVCDIAEFRILSFDGHGLREITKGIEILGCGSNTSLLLFLRDMLYNPNLTREQGIGLAAYLVKKATQYVDGCGEPVDVLVSSEDWLSTSAELVSLDRIGNSIQKMEYQEEFLSTLLIQTPFSSPIEQ